MRISDWSSDVCSSDLRIDRAIALLVDHAEDFAKAVSEDFGHRSREQTLMTDIMPSVSALKHAKKHMAAWSTGVKRRPNFPLGLLGATAEVAYQPNGVVGIVDRNSVVEGTSVSVRVYFCRPRNL